MTRLSVMCVVFALAGLACDAYSEPGPPTSPDGSATFGVGTALIDTGEGSTLIQVEFADDPGAKKVGLAGRDEIPEDAGMAFVYFEDQTHGFWMKDTKIPLSIAFFDVDGRIHTILDMDPCREDPCPTYRPEEPFRGALEVNQGAFERWGVEVGDKVTLTR